MSRIRSRCDSSSLAWQGAGPHVGDSMQPAGDGTVPCHGRGIVESVELVGVAVAVALRGSRIDTKQNTSELSQRINNASVYPPS
jgi:hypothetical protein